MNDRPPLSRPLLVLISGAPGAGKTTLAKQLAKHMGLYHVERDALKLGIEYTSRTAPKDRKHTVVPIYFELIFQLLKLRVSTIADGSHYKGESEADLKPYGEVAQVFNIHCKAHNHHERFNQRQSAEAEHQPKWLTPHMVDTNSVYARTSEPLEHGYQTLEVDTSDGYDPSIETIIAWIEGQLN